MSGEERGNSAGATDVKIPEDAAKRSLVDTRQPAATAEEPTVKSKVTFHCLNLRDLSEKDKEPLYQKLYAESEDMTYKFQELYTSTTKSLCARKVTVKDLVHNLECLGHTKPTFKDSGEPSLRQQLGKLREIESVDDAMSVINNYCSFFNYRMLEHIINKLGAEEDRENLARYKEDFARYGERHVFECPAVVGEMSEEGQANMFVTLDATFDDCDVNHLYAFVSNLERVLNITNSTLRLCRIGPGSLKLIFQLPLSVQRAIFPLSSDQEGALAGLGVTHLSCGDYQLTREEKKEVEDPASDEDSGHTDSEGSVQGSMDTMSRDIDLSSSVAGLAVGKPLDRFSLVTDSALGRSTAAASVTTAGVTQFSENLFDRELDDLDMGMGHRGTGTKNELHLASRRGDLEEVKRLTEEKGFNPLQSEKVKGWNALHYAAKGGHLGVMKYFVEERGYNPASQTSTGWTCLHYAACYNHLELVQYLIDIQNMDTMCQTKLGATPLHVACNGGNIDVVTYLITAVTKYLPLEEVVRYKCQHGQTPVHVAALHGHLELVKHFITKLNFDPNISDNRGQTLLHYAASRGHLHIVKFLIEQQNCNPAITDKDNVTPLLGRDDLTQ